MANRARGNNASRKRALALSVQFKEVDQNYTNVRIKSKPADRQHAKNSITSINPGKCAPIKCTSAFDSLIRVIRGSVLRIFLPTLHTVHLRVISHFISFFPADHNMASVKAWKIGQAGEPSFPDDFGIVLKAVLQVTDSRTTTKVYAIELHAAAASFGSSLITAAR